SQGPRPRETRDFQHREILIFCALTSTHSASISISSNRDFLEAAARHLDVMTIARSSSQWWVTLFSVIRPAPNRTPFHLLLRRVLVAGWKSRESRSQTSQPASMRRRYVGWRRHQWIGLQ